MTTGATILGQNASNQLESVFEGHPNALDVTLAKLLLANQSSLYNTLFNLCTSAAPLVNRVKTAVGETPNNILDANTLIALVNAIAAKTNRIGAYQ